MDEALYQLNIKYNPVTKSVELSSNQREDIAILGLLEMGKMALLRRSIAGNDAPRIAVPKP